MGVHELTNVVKKFLDRAPDNLYYSDTKSKNWKKFFVQEFLL